MAKSKLLASMQKGSKSWGDTSTRTLVTATLSTSKALHSLLLQNQGVSDFVRSNRGQASAEKS